MEAEIASRWKHVKNKEQLRYNTDSESKKDRYGRDISRKAIYRD